MTVTRITAKNLEEMHCESEPSFTPTQEMTGEEYSRYNENILRQGDARMYQGRALDHQAKMAAMTTPSGGAIAGGLETSARRMFSIERGLETVGTGIIFLALLQLIGIGVTLFRDSF